VAHNRNRQQEYVPKVEHAADGNAPLRPVASLEDFHAG